MANKPSRKQRKVIREKHQRAQAHGLPGRPLERPSRPSPLSWDSGRRASDTEEEDDEQSEPGTALLAKPPSWLERLQGLLERLKGLPMAAKLAAVIVVLLLVLGLIASQRPH